MKSPGPALALLCLLLSRAFPGVAAAADLEADLNGRYRGSWAVALVPLFSDCNDYYNDNEVSGTRVTSKARRRFAEGELVRVERIGVKRGRIDVFLDLAERVLAKREEGPFTLYDPLPCQVQLRIALPGRPDLAAAEAALGRLLERHGDAREAEASPRWNGRRREPFPPDYEKTLAAYESWKATQANAAVQARLDRALEEAARAADRIRSDEDYLQGLAAGVEKVRGRYLGDCGTLTGSHFSPDSGSGKSADWNRGYEDGQLLAHNLELARRLGECFVPVPPPPG